MANTVISLKKSGTPAAIPVDLANGELAINYADGKLYYKAANGSILSISGSGGGSNTFSTINANNTLIVSDSSTDILTLEPGKNITIAGDAVNDKITIGLTDDLTISGTLHVKAQGGLEGGQIELANAVSGSTLAGNVVIDIYGDRLRFYEKNSPNKGAFIDLSIAGSGVSTNLMSSGGGTTDTVARATADAAFAKANGALANTDGVTFGGTLLVSKNLSADRIISTNNGNGENYKVGDDAWIGDTNLADTVRIKGQQNPENAYISLGNNDGKLLGRAGAGPLTWDGNTIWTAGNDGSGSGLDADLLDGQDSSYFGTAIAVSAAYDKANSANLLAYNTGTGANAFTSATITGANAAVGAGANSYAATVGTSANAFASATIAGANTAVGAGANAYADVVGSSANSYLLSVIAGANAAVGAGANTVGSAAFDKANTAETIAIAAYANSNTKLSTSGGTITGDLAVVGNLVVSGNTSYISVQNYRVDDPLIYLAGNNYSSDIVDIGFIANYVNSTGSNVHTGLYREHTNKEYYLFQGYDEEPRNNHIDPNGNNFTLAVLNADLKTSNLALGSQNAIIWITAAYDKANAANVLAYDTGIGANAFASATIAGANVITFAAFDKANLANDIAVAAFEKANTGGGGGGGANALFQRFVANGSQTAFLLSNNVSQQNNTIVSVDGLLQIPDLHYTISGSILTFTTEPLDKSNIDVRVFSTTSTTIGTTGNNITVYLEDLYNHANIVGFAANTYASSVGVAANSYASGVIGIAANSYASGVGANANSYASVVGLAANSYARVVGTAGNTFAASVGTSANAYASSLVSSISSSVSIAYNTANAAFGKANSALANTSGASFEGNLNFPKGNVTVGNSNTSYLITVNGIEVGFRNIPWSGNADKTSTYTLQKGDVGEFVSIGANDVIIIPTATFSSGDIVSMFNNTGNTVNITCNAVTTYVGGNNTTRTRVSLATRGICTAFFYSSNVCIITGNIT